MTEPQFELLMESLKNIERTLGIILAWLRRDET